MQLDALIIAPHPDDAEISMAGTIVQLLEEGRRVGVLDLTDGEPTPYGSPEIRRAETSKATELLQLSWRENLGLVNRRLEPTLEARAQLANVIRRVRPRWLFTPYPEDAHPDHVAATKLVEDARFWSKLTKSELEGNPWHPERVYFYFSIHLRLNVQPDFIVDISRQWQRKLQSLECYRSQFITGRELETPSLFRRIEVFNAYFGHLIQAEFGEPFCCREPIGLTSLSSLR